MVLDARDLQHVGDGTDNRTGKDNLGALDEQACSSGSMRGHLVITMEIANSHMSAQMDRAVERLSHHTNSLTYRIGNI